MFKAAAKLLIFSFLFLISSKSAFAVNPYATKSATIKATVASISFNAPILVSPSDNSTSNNARQSLVWQRPSPLPSTPLHHYDVYLDGSVFASSVSDAITTQTYYFYTIRRVDDTFYLEMTSDFAEGYHTWKVVAYDNYGTSSSSETRTFYIDTLEPFIKLETVDHQTLNWDTTVFGSIPDINLRDLKVTTTDPLLTGKVEPYANMQIILLCPQNIPNCTNQVYLGNYPTGVWQHRFYNLVEGAVYTVYISATDTASNFTIFPEFYLAYGISTPALAALIMPTPEKVEPTITVTPTPEIEVPPIPFIPVPPLAPTPPIYLTATKTAAPIPIEDWSVLVLVFGLPLHLFMAGYGTQTSLPNIMNFLYTLFLPFLGNKTLQTIPFCTLEIFQPDKIDSTHQTAISDVNGKYSLKEPLPSNIFVKIICAGRVWKNSILTAPVFRQTCLFPVLETPETPPNRLRKHIMTYRSLPLIVAGLTSTLAMIFQPNYYYLVYLYLTLQFGFSEYIYPKISK